MTLPRSSSAFRRSRSIHRASPSTPPTPLPSFNPTRNTRFAPPVHLHTTFALATSSIVAAVRGSRIQQNYKPRSYPDPEPRPSTMASSSTAGTPLLYSCIAHNSTILTEHTASASSQTSSLPSIILPKIKHDTPQKLTYTHNNFYIHYIACAPSEYPSSQSSAGGLTYLVIAESTLGRRIPFGYLVNLQKAFLDQFDPQTTDFGALPSYGCAAFNGTLKKLMFEQGATHAGQQDALRTAQSEIDGVREIMTENIERVLERGERIDLLVDKTDRLGHNARDFRVRSRGLRRRMWWKNVKLMVLLILVVIFLLYLFVGFGCGLPAWHRCLRR